VVGGMSLWVVSFLVVGIVLLPLIGYSFGIRVRLPAHDEAWFRAECKQSDHLASVTDSLDVGAGLHADVADGQNLLRAA